MSLILYQKMSNAKLMKSIITEATKEFKDAFASQDEDGNPVEVDQEFITSFTDILKRALTKLSDGLESDNPSKEEISTLLKKLKDTNVAPTKGGEPKKLLTAYQAYQQEHKGNYTNMVPWKDLSEEEKKPYKDIAAQKNIEEGRVSSKGTKKATSQYGEFLGIMKEFNTYLPADVKPKPSGSTMKKYGLYSKDKSLEELRAGLAAHYNETYNLNVE
jgi:hypothetical protein